MSSASSAPAPSPDPAIRPTPTEVPTPAAVPPKGPGKKWLILGIVAVVLLAAGGLTLYQQSRSNQKGGGGSKGVVVPVMTVALGDLEAKVRVTGSISAKNYAALLAPRIQGSRGDMNRGGAGNVGRGTPSGGGGPMGGGPMNDFSLVLMTLAPAGKKVKTGDVVAQFDPQMQQQRLDDYRDSVVQMENQIRKMTANLAAARESHDQSVRSAKATWDRAVLDLQTAPIRSAIDAEKYKLAVEQASATYKQLVYEDSLVIEQQQSQIRIQQFNRDQSRIELQRAESNVQRMTIKSPMDGVVVMQSIVRNGEFGQIQEGDQVFAGQPFMQIVDPSSMVLNATVNQVDAQRLRLGMKATIHLDAYPDASMPGTLMGIGALSKTSTFRANYVGEIPILLKIDRLDPHVIPDLTGSAEIVLNAEKSVPVVPLESVFQEEGGAYVYEQGPQGWTKKKVELGLSSFTNVAIRSGLQKGNVIALQRPI